MTSTFEELAARFTQAVIKNGGPNKMGSGSMSIGTSVVCWDPVTIEWNIELFGYDIGDWPRHVRLGPFNSYEEALVGLEAKITDAEQVKDWEQEPGTKELKALD